MMYASTALLALAATGAIAVPLVERQTSSTVGPNTAAKAAGKLYFGTAVDNNDLSSSAYTTEEKNTNE